jgi:hypothetical protein
MPVSKLRRLHERTQYNYQLSYANNPNCSILLRSLLYKVLAQKSFKAGKPDWILILLALLLINAVLYFGLCAFSSRRVLGADKVFAARTSMEE